MARIWQSGFELSSSAKEFDITNGTLSISNSGIIRSGITSLECNPVTSFGGVGHYISNTDQTGNFYYRTYIYIASLPTSISTSVAGNHNDVTILALYDQAEANFYASVALDGSGVLRLYDASGVSEVVVATSSALSTGRWYRLELGYGATNGYYELLIDGTSIGSTSGVVGAGGVSLLDVGVGLVGSESCTADIYFDDLAINDTSGSSQTSWPGDGKIIHLHPAATGDKNTFATQVGGTAGSTQNWTRVNESNPDDATSYNASLTINQEDLFKVGANTLGAGDTINAVMVGLRFSNPVAVDATTTVKAEIEKAPGGTITQSAAIVPNSRTWRTNQPSVPRTYPIVTYQDPDGANWTNTTLGTMQIGYKLTTANVNSVGVSTVWAAFDYTPAPGASPVVSDAATASESVTLSETTLVNVSDTVTTSENVSVSIVGLLLSLNVADTVVTSESATPVINAIVSVSDSTVTAENTKLISLPLINASDSTVTSENTGLAVFGNVKVLDTSVTSESTGFFFQTYDVSVSDMLTTAENLSAVLSQGIQISVKDTSSVNTFEFVQLIIKTLFVIITDNHILDENGNFLLDENGNPLFDETPTETLTTSESLSLLMSVAVNVSDSIAVSENVQLNVLAATSRLVNVSDSISTSEAIGRLAVGNITISDQAALNESAIVNLPVANALVVIVSDSVVLSELVILPEGLVIVAKDTISLVELVSFQKRPSIIRTTSLTMMVGTTINFTFIQRGG